MDQSRLSFLSGRLQTAAKSQPDLLDLRHMLLKIGGIELVAPPSHDYAVPRLLSEGMLFSGKIAEHVMETSACHRNLAKLWSEGKQRLIGVGTGYALSLDGLWRQHSWGIRKARILETTVIRRQYFGILLTSALANDFAACNLV